MSQLERLFQDIRRFRHRDNLLELRAPVSRAHRAALAEPVKVADDNAYLELALPSLYGLFGILPDYFTDELLMEGRDREAMRRFLDIFNKRLLDLLFTVWERHRFFGEDPLQPESERARREAGYLNRLAGLLRERDEPLFMRGLRWHKVGLYRRSARSGPGLLDLLTTFLPDLEIELQSFVAMYRPIPSDQYAILGKGVLLGSEGNFLAGARIKDIGGGFRLFFRNLNYQQFMNLLPDGAWREQLATLVRDFTRNELECFVQVELRAEDIPVWRLGERRLGMNLWLKSEPATTPAVIDAGVLS